MSPAEACIAETILQFLASRGDRFATDHGLLRFHDVAGVLVAELDGRSFEVRIVVERSE